MEGRLDGAIAGGGSSGWTGMKSAIVELSNDNKVHSLRPLDGPISGGGFLDEYGRTFIAGTDITGTDSVQSSEYPLVG